MTKRDTKKSTSKKNTSKKTTTKKKSESTRAKKEPKIVVEYAEFIKTTQKDIMMSHMEEIVGICKQYEGIDEAPLEVWKRLNEIVKEVSIAARDADYTGSGYYRIEPLKRASYTISHRVREMERKRFIVELYTRMQDNPNLQDHFCNLIFLHISIWLSENSKVDKKKEEKD